MSCKHENHRAAVTVWRLSDTGRFTADITIKCSECGLPFRFLGLPAGLNLNGATVSVDGTELRVGIAPLGEDVPPVVASGFSIVVPQ